MTATSRWLGGTRSRADRTRARRARLVADVEDLDAIPLRKIPRRRKARPRKRFDFALPAQLGAQVQLPSIPVVRFGPRLLSAVLLACVLAAIQQAAVAPSFRVAEAAVEGNKILSEMQVHMIVGATDRPVFLVDPQGAERALEAHPEVLSAEVEVSWPNRVRVSVVERHPMVEWDDAGRTWWICPDGVAYLKNGEWPGLVLVRSESSALTITEDPLQPAMQGDVLRAAAVLNAQMPEEAASLLFDADHGLGFDDPRGWRAYFGVDGDLVVKVRAYQAIVANLAQVRQAVAVISVEDAAAPYIGSER
ncbi:MAG: FtsQ-type POTRA domain-containing protein [Chloroflexi bacterium]|nr:FtsQ-type POTRA domain-containing protein [Chloroflexota bacterium]